jgi:hypothetical protein
MWTLSVCKQNYTVSSRPDLETQMKLICLYCFLTISVFQLVNFNIKIANIELWLIQLCFGKYAEDT